MKKIIMFMLIVLSIGLNAQKYVPFPSESAQWNIKFSLMMYTPPINTTILKYSLQGDTIIKNISYKKVCKNIGSDANPNYKGVGGLREQDKKIYYVGESYAGPGYISDREVLLYDFTKQVGDTVWLDKQTNSTNYIINRIDSVKVGNNFRKRYATKRYGLTEYIIEGIGNVNSGLFGIITPIPTCMECLIEWDFICFSQNGESVYKNPDYVDCNSTQKWTEYPYTPFPTEKAIWSELKSYQGQCDYPNYCKYQYKILGDTLINSTLYHKIYQQNDTLPGNANAFYYGAMREQAKKIYFCSKDNISEVRLYDFSKNVGDTIQVQLGFSNNIYKQVASITRIDKILVNDKYRKVFYLNSLSGESVWIEGIGSTNGLFYPIIPPLSCICSWNLVCFHQNNSVVYVNHSNALSYLSATIACFPSIIDGINNVVIKNSVTISPNPVTSTSILKWSGNETFSTLFITDLLGKTIRAINIKGLSETSISRNDFMKGLYIGRLVSETGSEETVKIIVQ